MNRCLLCLIPLGLAVPLAAQQPAAMTTLPPREVVALIIPSKTEQDRAIEIAAASVHTRLVGPLAETTVTLVFHNPNGRAMEGELSYPLPPDATLQGYALDVNGKMVDGVPVPKQKARVAFEEEQRRGIDPGLAEWSGGNRFKTRISPIPAQGQRTITLRYTSMVQQSSTGTSYRLPLDFEKVGSFKLRIEALSAAAPQVQASGLGNLAFTPWQNRFVLEREWKELALKEDLVFDLPQGMADAPAVERHEGQFYLAKLIAAPQGGSATLPKAPVIDLIWDCSASMEKVDKAPILEALRLYFASNPNCLVRLTCVRDTVEPAPEWNIENGDASHLLEALKAMRYHGATADMPVDVADNSPLCLLVTDGNVTLADKPFAASAKVPTYALVASSGTDLSALRRWGAVPVDLLRQKPEEALARVPAWQMAGVELDGKPWDGALTNAPGGVVEGPVLLTGILPEGKHEVTLIFRSAEGEQRVSFPVDTAGAAEGRLNRSFYAQNKLASLLMQPESPARGELLRRLGEEYGLVTPGTSLLVLEDLQQYLRHEVRPPACCPELRERYDASIAERAKQNATQKEMLLSRQKARAVRLRTELQAWYGTDFSKADGGVNLPTTAELRAAAAAEGASSSEEVNRLLSLAFGYYELGKFDEAFAEFARVLELEPDNTAARRGMEAVNRLRQAYYRIAHDSYRARALGEVGSHGDEARAERVPAANEPAGLASPAPAPEQDGDEEDAFDVEEEENGDSAPAPAPAPVVVLATGAAPVSMAAVTVEANEMEADEEEEGEEGEEGEDEGAARSSAPAPVVIVGADKAADEAAAPAIRVPAWSSEAPYLAALKAAENPFEAYHVQRRTYAKSPGFYLDCADFFEQKGERAMAVSVLSNLLEMELENRSLMRAVAYKLRYMGETDAAITVFRKVQELFPEEPQSHRDLALACADARRWQEAVDTLRLVFEKPMDSRFYGIEQVAAVELAGIIARAQREGKPVNTDGIEDVWLKPIEADLRIVINWDTDMADMDLWVTDPGREKCFYSHKLTRTGGRMSRDVTQGYGPEEFLIRKALPGDYKVQAHYYGNSSMKMLAPVTLYAELYTDYGRPTEKRQTLVFRLNGQDQEVHIGDIAHTPLPDAPATRDYQVRAGETWESIAEKELGSAARAADIISLNPGARAEVPPSTGSIIRLPKH